jgi:hypothetical protein
MTIFDKLSPRENQIARLLLECRTNKEIASQLFISERTVKFHMQAIYRKMGIPVGDSASNSMRIDMFHKLAKMAGTLVAMLLLASGTHAQTHSATVTCTQPTQPGSEVIASTNLYRDSVKIANVPPTPPCAYVDTTVLSGETHTYSATNVDTNAVESTQSNAVTVTIPGSTPPPPPTDSLWSLTNTPANLSTTDSLSVELGVKFTSTVAGQIAGIRWYKPANSTVTHTGTLWSASGTKLTSGTFSGETASGWQTLTFATPISINANTTYVASIHTTHYAWDQSPSVNSYAAAHSSPPLAAPVSAGVYTYGSSSLFPTSSWQSSNYWVDVLFIPAPSAPSVTISPTSASVLEGGTVQFTTAEANTTAPITWSANAPNGLFTAGSTAGTATVTATAGTVSASATVTITAPPPNFTLTISGDTITIAPANIPSGTAFTCSVTSDGVTKSCSGTIQ